MKVALITGCSGLIGSQSVDFFINQGFYVVGIDNHMRGYFFGSQSSTEPITKKLLKTHEGKFSFFNVDIRNFDDLSQIFQDYSDKIEVIIHTAAQPSHDWAAKEPLTDFTVNALGTVNLLELTRKYCKKASFIFTSTNKVYGDKPNSIDLIELETRYSLNGNNKFGIDENMSIDNSLHSVFGASKVAADIMVQEYGKYFDMNTVCFRGGCLTGPQHSGAELHGFLSYLIKCVVNRKKYIIFGYNGKQVRDNIHSWDLVNMFWYYHKNPKKGVVYNAGGGVENSISILEAINQINSICKQKVKGWKDWNNFEVTDDNRKGDHIYYVTNFDKFKNDYPEWPGITISLKSLIGQMVENEINLKK